jgi:hypothetical protein
MKRKEKKENVKIDLFNLEKEKISAQAMGNVLGGEAGGLPSLCDCKEYDGYNSTNRTLR